jgi:hypothetical protein
MVEKSKAEKVDDEGAEGEVHAPAASAQPPRGGDAASTNPSKGGEGASAHPPRGKEGGAPGGARRVLDMRRPRAPSVKEAEPRRAGGAPAARRHPAREGGASSAGGAPAGLPHAKSAHKGAPAPPARTANKPAIHGEASGAPRRARETREAREKSKPEPPRRRVAPEPEAKPESAAREKAAKGQGSVWVPPISAEVRRKKKPSITAKEALKAKVQARASRNAPKVPVSQVKAEGKASAAGEPSAAPSPGKPAVMTSTGKASSGKATPAKATPAKAGEPAAKARERGADRAEASEPEAPAKKPGIFRRLLSIFKR